MKNLSQSTIRNIKSELKNYYLDMDKISFVTNDNNITIFFQIDILDFVQNILQKRFKRLTIISGETLIPINGKVRDSFEDFNDFESYTKQCLTYYTLTIK